MLLNLFKGPTKHCKICFDEIRDFSLNNLLNKNSVVCDKCFANFKPKFIEFKHGFINCLAIYYYDSNIRELLYKYKGCYDYELKDVFLDRYIWYLKLRYFNYKIVYVPSYYLDDDKRGYNHVRELGKLIGKDVLDLIKKNKNHKQADMNKKRRKEIKNVLEINEYHDIKNKKILILDDVYTTGSSVDAVINLLLPLKPKKIEVLVIAKNDKNKQ